jgi:hypothetical protein
MNTGSSACVINDVARGSANKKPPGEPDGLNLLNLRYQAQGRPPVGNGHDAAGFRAVFAPGAAAVEGAAAAGFLAAGFLTIFFLLLAFLRLF